MGSSSFVRFLDRMIVPPLLSGAGTVAGGASLRNAERMGLLLGSLCGRLPFLRKNTAERQIKDILGESVNAGEIIDRMYKSLGLNVLECLKLRQDGLSFVGKVISGVEGEEHLSNAVKAGDGIIILTAHLGNWELLAAWLCARGYPINAVIRPPNNPAVARFIGEMREKIGLRVLNTEAMLQAARLLKKGEFVGILADQHAGAKGLMVDFMGRQCSTAGGPSALALAAHVKVVPMFIIREGMKMAHKVIVRQPLVVPTVNDRHSAVIAGTEFCNKAIGEEIHRHPEQWLWLHRRWRD